MKEETEKTESVSGLFPEWADDCLACDPFEGDFGNTTDRTLSDKIIKARKQGPCHLCGGVINPREYARSRTDIFDGELHYFRWCKDCCKAMAQSWYDNGEMYEGRVRAIHEY